MRCTAIGTSSIANATWPSPALPARMSGRSAKRSKVLAATNGHANVVSYAASMPLSSFHHSLGSRFVAPGLVATDHYVEVPLDYTDPMSEKITVFVRELIAPNRMDIEQPGLLYLQGQRSGSGSCHTAHPVPIQVAPALRGRAPPRPAHGSSLPSCTLRSISWTSVAQASPTPSPPTPFPSAAVLQSKLSTSATFGVALLNYYGLGHKDVCCQG